MVRNFGSEDGRNRFGIEMITDGYCLKCESCCCQHLGASPQILSPADLQLIGYVMAGDSNKDIGWRLNISETAVKTRLHRIYSRLHIHDRGNPRVRLAAWANEKLRQAA